MDISRELRYQRKNAKLSQAELARKARVSKAYYWQLESQPGKQPSAEILYRIALVLHISIEEFFTSKKYCQRCGVNFEVGDDMYYIEPMVRYACAKCYGEYLVIKKRHGQEIGDWINGRHI